MTDLVAALLLFLQRLATTIGQAQMADPAAWATVNATPYSGLLALGVAVVAGVSLLLGQSAVLFTNRLSRGRFTLTIALSTLVYVFVLATWAVTLWLVSALLYDIQASARQTLTVILLGQAPLVWGFLIFLPYLGAPITILLRLWSLVVIIVQAQALTGLSLPQVFLTAIWGWLVIELLTRILGQQLAALRNRVWRHVTGIAYDQDAREAIDDVTHQLRQELATKQTRG